jgi:predicted amidohydrolase
VSICEDAFSPTGPIAAQAAGGAELVVNINASPYYANRLAERERKRVAVASADIHRPAAREQLATLAGQIGVTYLAVEGAKDAKATTASE